MAGLVNMDVLNRLLDDTAPSRGGIGFVGADVPVDLLLATGRSFGHLPWSDKATPWADRWLESGFPFWTRTILEDWHGGRFDALTHVVFSRAEDSAQRLYYYVRELQSRGLLRGPRRSYSTAHSSTVSQPCAHGRCGGGSRGQSRCLAGRFDRGIEWQCVRRRFAALQAGRQGAGAFYENGAPRCLFWILGLARGSAVTADARAPGRVLLAGSVPPMTSASRGGGGRRFRVAERTAFSDATWRRGRPGSDALWAWRAMWSELRRTAQFWRPRAALVRGARERSARVILWLTRRKTRWAGMCGTASCAGSRRHPALVMTSRDWRAAMVPVTPS